MRKHKEKIIFAAFVFLVVEGVTLAFWHAVFKGLY